MFLSGRHPIAAVTILVAALAAALLLWPDGFALFGDPALGARVVHSWEAVGLAAAAGVVVSLAGRMRSWERAGFERLPRLAWSAAGVSTGLVVALPFIAYGVLARIPVPLVPRAAGLGLGDFEGFTDRLGAEVAVSGSCAAAFAAGMALAFASRLPTFVAPLGSGAACLLAWLAPSWNVPSWLIPIPHDVREASLAHLLVSLAVWVLGLIVWSARTTGP